MGPKRKRTEVVAWTFNDHLCCAERIWELWYAIDFYIEEVHRKKATSHWSGKFILNSKQDQQFYKKHLFHGKGGRDNFQSFPSVFQCQLDSCFFADIPTYNGRPLYIYYASETQDSGKKKASTGYTPLSSHETLTENDKKLISDVNHEIVVHMDYCIQKIQSHGNARSDLMRCRKMIANIAKC